MSTQIKKILSNVSQSLSESEKAQARSNIGATKCYLAENLPSTLSEFNAWANALDSGVPILPAPFGVGTQLGLTNAEHSGNIIHLEYVFENNGAVKYNTLEYTKSGSTVTLTTNKVRDLSANRVKSILSGPNGTYTTGGGNGVYSDSGTFSVKAGDTLLVNVHVSWQPADTSHDFSGRVIIGGSSNSDFIGISSADHFLTAPLDQYGSMPPLQTTDTFSIKYDTDKTLHQSVLCYTPDGSYLTNVLLSCNWFVYGS